MPLRHAIFLLLSFVVSSLAAAPAPPPLKDAPPASAPGVSITFQSRLPNLPLKSDLRSDRLLALYVPQGAPPTPFLPPGPFTAKLESDLTLRLRDEITFSVAALGTVRLIVNDQPIIDIVLADSSKRFTADQPIRLNKGKNRIVIQYQGPATGDAMLRLYWSAGDFPPEPIPPTVLSHDHNAPPLRENARLRAGRELFANLRCAACHSDPAGAASLPGALPEQPSPTGAGLAMPELATDAPALTDIAARRNEAWLAHWINHPRALRPDARMPRLFHSAADDALDPRALDIAAYLASLAKPAAHQHAELPPASIKAGSHLFAFLRCAGCHTLPDNPDVDSDNRVPLRHVKSKFPDLPSLIEFLKQPEKHYAWIRMPNFALSNAESRDLAAFLFSREQKSLDLPQNPIGDAQRGKTLLTSSGCLNCHALTIDHTPVATALKAPQSQAIPDDRWSRGCLAPSGQLAARAAAPDFSLSDDQRDALLAFLATDRSSLGRESLAEFSQRQFASLNCIACHARDDLPDIFSSVEQEVADLIADVPPPQPGESDISPDQSEPNLTWLGEKLKPEWSRALLTGKLEYRLRPWLRARMPAFPSRGLLMAHGFPLEHGFAPASEAPIARDPSLADAGRTLAGKEGGFACITCHDAGPMKAVGVFEAPGINFQYTDERINRHYYDRWVYNPLRIQKDTKMPAFADPAGKTSIQQPLDGDARRQYDAIYHYLLEARQIRPPEN